ncbi:mucoidy inhibitor MuiA family protein [Pedobacter frigiditerrae]|uniref:Mucoidy inhibitor MuiA family protein n=2 Tax=Pedobacter frigiditerrae TaxID=2530452 RepID=A0A4R0MJ60_9SPHI|nr:mucoidy inhibitor MuiA family protein [Pedobacter frigiditerrae]
MTLMRNLFLFTILILSNFLATAQENQISAISKITNVTVFISGAQVYRQTETFDVPQGVSQFIFAGLSSAIDVQSIQAKGEGNFTILSVTQQKNFLLEKKNSEEKANYINTIADLNEKILLLRNESEVYKAEEEMLVKNQIVMGPNVNYDLVKLKQALDFQKQRLSEAKNKQIEITRAIAKLQTDLNKYNNQLNELNGKSLKNSNDVIVKVSSKLVTKGKFSLTYMVNNAGWYPTYDIRAKDVSSPIELVYKANVSQSSGEDWKNVRLALSSGNPTTNSTKPSLGTYNLGYIRDGYSTNNISTSSVRIIKGKVFGDDGLAVPGVSIRVKNTSVGTSTDVNGNYTIQLPVGAITLVASYIGYVTKEIQANSNYLNINLEPDSKSLDEVVVVGYGSSDKSYITGSVSKAKKETHAVEVNAVEKQTNVVFDIKNPYTILSDGKQFAVEIGDYDFKADYEYFAAPKLSEEAFLTAKINGFSEANLISGEANIFFEGTYLGKTLLDVQNSSDTLTLSLGTDKNVIIKREKQKDFNEKQFIGSSQKDSRSFIIDIKNRKSQAINLIIEDQLPISTNSDITVDRQEISKARYDETNGKLTWQMVLQPNEQKKLALKYQVKYPKNRPINLE